MPDLSCHPENLCAYIWRALVPVLPGLAAVRVALKAW
jgi:hypothetical protein